MGPELIAVVVGPLFGGMMSVMIWLSKKNTDKIDTGFSKLTTSVNIIERKVDSLQIEMIKNYATRSELVSEIHDLKYEMREALSDSKIRGTKLADDIETLRNLYWETRETIYNHEERDSDEKGSGSDD